MTPFGWLLTGMFSYAVVRGDNALTRGLSLFLALGILIWGTGTGL
jgi:hypothetical protein